MATRIVLKGQPIRTTEQQHRFGGIGRNGKAIIYRDAKLSAARQTLIASLLPHRPAKPMGGPVLLQVEWRFGTTDKTKLKQRWKTTRPDTDNMIKLLKDCMTETGFWKDDAQIVQESLAKSWTTPERAETVIIVTEISAGLKDDVSWT